MKYLLILLLALIPAVWIGLGLHHTHAMMIITFAGWRVDFPLWLALLAAILIYFIFYFIMRLFVGILSTTLVFRNFSIRWRKQRAKTQVEKGLIALAEGRWDMAEQLLAQTAKNSEYPWFNYLCAAKAADELKKDHLRDEYLQLANSASPETDIAVRLTQAKFQLYHQQFEQSVLILSDLENKSPHHPYLLKLLVDACLKLGKWERLLALLPRLKHRHVFSKEELNILEITIWYECLSQQKSLPISNLEAIWKKIPKQVQMESKIALLYANTLQMQGKPVEAEIVLRNAIKHEWKEELIKQYGYLTHPAPQQLLTTSEGWLNLHPESPALLATLGRLCEQQQLWGKAQRYFEASLSLAPLPQTYAEIGRLLEKMNKPELGAQYFKKGLLAMVALKPQEQLPRLIAEKTNNR